uniref:Cadherin domain-containing protein n=1 Tax=Romanomermis culicivorax TaxID=13658 RepID=A0A915L203_ROMCU
MKNLGSGQVSYIKYDLKTDSSSYVYDFDQAVLDNGAFMEVEVEKFRVVRTLAVSRRGLPKFLIQNFSYARNDTLWVFNPDTTILQRAVPSVPSNRPIQSTRTADNATYKTLLVTFPITNLHSGEAILGSFDASLLNGTYTCIVFSSHDQEFSSGDFWIDANSKVNFVDAFLSSNISSIQYEFTFGTKINIASLNFIDPPRNLTLDFDNEIGEELVKIRTSNGRESNIRYSIFDKYNLFKIDESSGSITLNRNFPIDANDYCLTVIAQTDGSSSKAVNATTVKVIFPRKYHEEFECTPFTYNAGVPDGNSTTTIWTIHPMSTSTGSILSSGQRGPLPRETTSIPITSTNNATESSIEINEAASSRMMTISLAVTEMQTTSASTEVFSQTSTLHQTTSTFISMPTEQRESTTTDFGLQFTRNNSIMVVSTVALSQTTSQSPSYELSTLTSMRAVITPQTTNFVDHSLILQTEVSPKASDSQWKISTTEISTTVKNLPSTVTDEINNENYQPTTFASKNATFETDIDQTLIAQSISPTDIRAYNNEEMVRTACGLRHTKLVYAVICDLGKRKINSG